MLTLYISYKCLTLQRGLKINNNHFTLGNGK